MKVCHNCKSQDNIKLYSFKETEVNWKRYLCENCGNKLIKKIAKHKALTLKFPHSIHFSNSPENPQKWWKKIFKKK